MNQEIGTKYVKTMNSEKAQQLKMINLMEKNHFKIIHQKELSLPIQEENKKKLEIKKRRIRLPLYASSNSSHNKETRSSRTVISSKQFNKLKKINDVLSENFGKLQIEYKILTKKYEIKTKDLVQTQFEYSNLINDKEDMQTQMNHILDQNGKNYEIKINSLKMKILKFETDRTDAANEKEINSNGAQINRSLHEKLSKHFFYLKTDHQTLKRNYDKLLKKVEYENKIVNKKYQILEKDLKMEKSRPPRALCPILHQRDHKEIMQKFEEKKEKFECSLHENLSNNYFNLKNEHQNLKRNYDQLFNKVKNENQIFNKKDQILEQNFKNEKSIYKESMKKLDNLGGGAGNGNLLSARLEPSEEFEKLKKLNINLNFERDNLKQKIKILEKNNMEPSNILQKKENEIISLYVKCEALKEKITSLESKIDFDEYNIIQEKDTQLKIYNKIKNLEKEKQNVENEKQNFKNEMKILAKENKEIKKNYENLQKLNNSSNLHYMQLKNYHGELNTEIISRKMEMTKEKENLESLLHDLTLTLNLERENSKQKIKDLENNVIETKNILQKNQNEIKNLNFKCDDWKQKTENLEKRKKDYDSYKILQEKESQRRNDDKEKIFEKEKEKQNFKNAILTNENVEMKQRYERLQKMNADLNSDYMQSKKKCENLKVETISTKMELTKEKKHIELQVDQLTLEFYKLKKKYNDLSIDFGTLTNEHEMLQYQQAANGKDFETLTDEYEILQYKQAILKQMEGGKNVEIVFQKSTPHKSLKQYDQNFKKIKNENIRLNGTIHKNTENYETKLQTLEKRLTSIRNVKKIQMKKCQNCIVLEQEIEKTQKALTEFESKYKRLHNLYKVSENKEKHVKRKGIPKMTKKEKIKKMKQKTKKTKIQKVSTDFNKNNEEIEIPYEEVRNKEKHCKCKLGMTTFKSSHDFFCCNRCLENKPSGTAFYGCRKCDFDVCEKCFENNGTKNPEKQNENMKVILINKNEQIRSLLQKVKQKQEHIEKLEALTQNHDKTHDSKEDVSATNEINTSCLPFDYCFFKTIEQMDISGSDDTDL